MSQPEIEKTKTTQNVARTAIIKSIERCPMYFIVLVDSRAFLIIKIVIKKDRLSNKAPSIPTGNWILK